MVKMNRKIIRFYWNVLNLNQTQKNKIFLIPNFLGIKNRATSSSFYKNNTMEYYQIVKRNMSIKASELCE